MARTVAAACLLLSFSYSLKAAEVCVVCEKPAATYRCTLEHFLKEDKHGLEAMAEGHVCEKVLAKTGPHKVCRVVGGADPCDGPQRTVTLTDYQRALAGDGETTYQPGILELAQRKIKSAWNCVASLFKDC